MITQKERKLLIMMLILILVVTLMLTVSIISFVSQPPVVEPEETIAQVELQPVTEPEETIPEMTQIIAETEPAIVEPQSLENDYDTEFLDFCMITFAESGAESVEGQIAVAAVIINRKEDTAFPDTFYGVINQANQFSPVQNGKIYSEIDSYEELPDKTIEAVERALEGEDPTEQLLREEAIRLGLDPEKYAEGGALYFYNPNRCSWQQLAAREKIKVKVKIGNHVFYKVWDT